MAQTKLWGRGQLTIPVSLRRELGMDEEEILQINLVGKSLLLTPKKLLGDGLARKVEREMKKQGLSLEDLLNELKQERTRYHREKYG